MRFVFDAFYLTALALLSPWLIYKAIKTGKLRRGLRDKLLGLSPCQLVSLSACHPVWFHGVSVGEIHLLRQVVAAFRRRYPDRTCVISTTTDTGYDEARRCFPDLAVFWFPFDFSWAVRRTLHHVDPALIVLAEGELWPNFLAAAKERGIPVAVVNGRMSPRSLRRYQLLAPLTRGLFRRLDLLLMQTEEYAAAVRALGAPAEKVHVTGSVKYDGVAADRDNPRTRDLRRLLNVADDELAWVAGSTMAPEEEIVIALYQRLHPIYPKLRLFLAPRQKDRFDEAAKVLERAGVPFVRRSALPTPGEQGGETPPLPSVPSVVLVDTIGDLGALWGLADVAFVGGSLDGRRGGQNMIEPAAYGAAVVFGPHVWNFKEPAARLVEVGGAAQVKDTVELSAVVTRLLGDVEERRRLGTASRQFVQRQQGATERTVALLDELLVERTKKAAA